MQRSHQASRCRQRIMNYLGQLQQLAQATLGHAPLVRGSLYVYRRRCGKPGCRCARGRLHRGRALGVSEGGRSRPVAIGGIDPQALSEHVERYRHVRRARMEMVQVFSSLLTAADRLESLRAIAVERLRRSPGRVR